MLFVMPKRPCQIILTDEPQVLAILVLNLVILGTNGKADV